MPRDYAKTSSRTTKRAKKPGPLPGWVWMIGGLTIGLLVALLVYLNNSRHPGEKTALAKIFEQTTHDTREVKKPPVEAPREKSDLEKPKPASEEKPKPSFDFYYILPELEVAVPEQELAAQSKQQASHGDQKIEYILQAGSFRQLEQADQLKAKLALQGIEADIQTVKINADTWHRVRIGPINNMNKLEQTRKRLNENGISAIVVKSKT